jgi:TonB family protein
MPHSFLVKYKKYYNLSVNQPRGGTAVHHFIRFTATACALLVTGAYPSAAALAADAPPRPQDPLWQNAVCGNPTLPRSVIRHRQEGHVAALFDIDADGNVENIRLTESVPDTRMDYGVRRALTRWRYFLYFEDGIAAPRKNVPITFTYGSAPRENSCTHTALPERASTAGDAADPYNQLKTCFTLVMPRASARDRQSGRVDLRYDVTTGGAVENARVTGATADGIFNQAALAALGRWNYYPFKRAGEAVARQDVAVSFFFGALPAGQNDHRCGYAPFDATHSITKTEAGKKR